VWGRREMHVGVLWRTLIKKPLVKSRHRWEDNFKMDLQELDEVMEWIDRSQYRDR
jgi:hypothetical protein